MLIPFYLTCNGCSSQVPLHDSHGTVVFLSLLPEHVPKWICVRRQVSRSRRGVHWCGWNEAEGFESCRGIGAEKPSIFNEVGGRRCEASADLSGGRGGALRVFVRRATESPREARTPSRILAVGTGPHTARGSCDFGASRFISPGAVCVRSYGHRQGFGLAVRLVSA